MYLSEKLIGIIIKKYSIDIHMYLLKIICKKILSNTFDNCYLIAWQLNFIYNQIYLYSSQSIFINLIQ